MLHDARRARDIPRRAHVIDDDGIDVLHRGPDRTHFDAPPRGVGQAARRRARARYRRGRIRARD